MKQIIVGAVALAAVLAVAAIFRANQAEWERRVERVTAQARVELAAGAEERARADSLQAEVGILLPQIGRVDTLRLEAVRADTIPVPEGCEVVAAAKDRIIFLTEHQLGLTEEALEVSQASVRALRVAEAKAAAAADSLLAVLDDRPKARPGWIPSVSIGPFAGFCHDGRACAGAGIQLSWEVKLF